MKLFNQQTSAQSANGVHFDVNFYGDGYSVNASVQNGERRIGVSLQYDKSGIRTTDVTDYSEPFTTAFYAEMDGYMSKLANANGYEAE